MTLDRRERFAPVCPDVVFEIISPSDSRRVSRERADAFLKNGAAIVVLIDPYQRWIEVNGEERAWEPISLAFPGCDATFELDPRDLE